MIKFYMCIFEGSSSPQTLHNLFKLEREMRNFSSLMWPSTALARAFADEIQSARAQGFQKNKYAVDRAIILFTYTGTICVIF